MTTSGTILRQSFHRLNGVTLGACRLEDWFFLQVLQRGAVRLSYHCLLEQWN